MKTSQIARDMLKDRQTIKAWVDHPALQERFSSKARGLEGEREFSEGEYDTLNCIRVLRDKNIDFGDIARELNNGYRTDEPPPGIATRSTTMPATIYANQTAMTRENEDLRRQLAEERARSERVIADERARLERQQSEHAAAIERIMAEWRGTDKDMNREIGRLENKIETLQEQLDELRQQKKSG